MKEKSLFRDTDSPYRHLNLSFRLYFLENYVKLGLPYNLVVLSDDYAFIQLEESINYINLIESIAQVPGLVYYEFATKLAPLSIVSNSLENGVPPSQDIGVEFFKNNPNISLHGNNVLIGVCDSGIDYLHKDFIYPDGTSKIVYLWDQSKEGNPPDGYYFGTEYTREDINKAIKENDPSLSVDEDGTGTMIAGICAGLGNIEPLYQGVAEDAELIIVKLGKLDGDYTSSFHSVAHEYCLEKARELDRPLVSNVTMGANSGLGTDESSFLYELEDDYIIVAAAGNEADKQTHTSGKIEYNGESQFVEFEVGQDEGELTIYLWGQRPDIFDVAVYTPSGEFTRNPGAFSNFSDVRGTLDFEGTRYSIFYNYPSFFTGMEYVRITLRDVKKGIWRIKITGTNILNGQYDLYLENSYFSNPGTRFRNPDPNRTITYPAVFYANVTVGAYNSNTTSLWSSSSRGNTTLGYQKPHVVAPGVNIIAPYPGNTYATITGTAAAAAHVAGIAAMYLQLVSNNMYKSKRFLASFKTFLELGAIRSKSYTYPNNFSGYGRVSAIGLFEMFR
jgi:hypothetical protein